MSPISNWGRSLTGPYPRPSTWPSYEPGMRGDAYRFASLWLTEGIPFAFRDCPMSFEYCRERLAKQLDEVPKSISMVGSARLGASLDPKKFGHDYDHATSDIDLFMVSSNWFEKLRTDAELWLSRYRSRLAEPRHPKEAAYWEDNAARLPSTMKRGFVDIWVIPSYKRYSHAQELRRTLNTFKENLNEHLPRESRIRRDVGIRVYEDWDSALKQIGYSFVQAWERHSAMKPHN